MISKKQILIGLLVFFLGAGGAFASGYYISRNSASVPELTNAVLGTALDSQTPALAPAESSPPPPAPLPPPVSAPTAVPLPAAQAPSLPKPKPKVNICQVAKETLAKVQDAAEVKFQSDSASAKTQYDTEQNSIATQAAELMKQRTQSINDYLTTIAVATSKYNNSSKAPGDYQNYEQEQGAALAIHNHGIAEIATKETIAATTKADSQTKYDEAIKIFEAQKTQALSEAQINYQAQTAGLVCP